MKILILKIRKAKRWITKTRRRKILISLLALLILLTGIRFIFFAKPKETRAATVELTTSSSTVQVDVANRYRAILQKDDTTDYILFYDRAENDSTPDPTHEFRGPCILETNTYCLRDDANRITTILEATDTRVIVRVEGMFNNEAGTDYLDDESGTPIDLTVTVDYTFTSEGVFVENTTDFKTTGVTLDAATGLNGYTWLGVYADVTDGAYDDTANITYGDGASQTQTSTDPTDFEDSNTYVHLEGNGSSTYQDAFVGIQLKGWYDDSGGTDDWLWDEDETSSGGTEQDLIAAQEQNHQTSGKHYMKWFFLMLAEADVNTEIEREGFINDFRNPDIQTYTTGSQWNDNPVSPALEFDGSSAYLNVPSPGLPTGDFTYEAWIYPDNLTTRAIYNALQGSGSDELMIRTSSQRYLQVTTNNSLRVTSATQLNTGKWTHVAVTRSGSTISIYINGVLDPNTGTDGGVLSFSTCDLLIGTEADSVCIGSLGSYFDGIIDEARVWSDARTQQEIRDNMFKQIDPGSANLSSYWRFNENTGNTTYDPANSHDASLNGTTNWVTAGHIPDHYNEAENSYPVSMSSNDAEFDLNAQSNVSNTLNGAVSSGATSITLTSSDDFPSSGVAYIQGDKFSYTANDTGTEVLSGIPSTGELSVIGHASGEVVSQTNRHKPFYKLRNYRSLNEPSSVALEGSLLTEDTDYVADIKPFTTAYFAQDLLWYSTMESDSAITSSNVGDGGTEGGLTPADYIEAKSGKGARITAADDDVGFTTANNFSGTAGTVEFWYNRGGYTPAASGCFWGSVSNFGLSTENMTLCRGGNDTDIDFEVDDGTVHLNSWDGISVDIYDNNWHHIRLVYDSATDAPELYLDGIQQTRDATNGWNSITPQTYIQIAAVDDQMVDGIYDEFKVYDSTTAPTLLAVGGDTSETDEYLADDSNDYTFDFNADDAANRGEYVWIGTDAQFLGVNVTLATNGVGSNIDFDWEYWDGSDWVALEVTEGPAGGAADLTSSGVFYFTAPSDWYLYSMNDSTELYFIRGHLESGSYSTDPKESIVKTDILNLHYQSNLTSENQTFEIPTNSGAPNAYWGFNEGYGSTAYDSTGNENDGTITNATWQTEDLCYSGKCLHYDGDGDYVSRADDPELDVSASYTITAWVRHPEISTSADVIMAKFESTGSDGGYRIQMESDGDISFGIDDENTSFPEDSVTSTTADYDDNRWHHLAAVKDGTNNLYLYIDGQLIDTDSSISATNTLENDDTFYIGIDGDGSSNDWDGFIDEAKVYRYARSANEVKTDYVKGAGRRGSSSSFGIRDYSFLSDGLVGFWKMDDAGVDAEGETSTDSSGNANSGTLYGDDSTGDNGTGMDCTASGKFGTGCDFDGTDDYVVTTTNNGLVISTSVTNTTWLKADANDGTMINGGHTDGNYNNYQLYIASTGELGFRYRNSGGTLWHTYQSNNTYTWTDGWHHAAIAFTYGDGNSAKLYRDGVLISGSWTDGDGSDLPWTTNVVNIARRGSSLANYFDGTIDEVRVYNRALTPSEVRQLADWAPGPVGYWNFDQMSGTSVTDRSGNNNTANWNVDGNHWETGKYGGGGRFELNGTDDLDAGNNSSLDINNAITVEYWLKPTVTFDIDTPGTHQALFSRSGWIYNSLRDDSGYMSVSLGNATSLYFTRNSWEPVWTHIAITYDGTVQKNHINGNLDAQGDRTITFNNANNLYIGEYNTSSGIRFDGTMDDIRIYNYARTQEQIVEDMNAGHPAPGSPIGSPVLNLKFDEGYGDTANDSSPQGNNGDLAGSGNTCPGSNRCPAWTNSGKFDKALNFDDTGSEDDYLEIGDIATYDFAQSDSEFTLSAWIYADTTSGGNDNIISKYNTSGNNRGWRLDHNNGQLELFLSEDGTYSDTTAVHLQADNAFTATTWHHIAATIDVNTDTFKFYVDGIEVPATHQNSKTTITDISSNTAGVYIASIADLSQPGNFFDGKIDEVKIYNFALTADQVKADYNQASAAVWGASSTDSSGVGTWDSTNEYCPPRSSGTCTAPVAEWKFDEKIGTDAYDTSENPNNITVMSGGTPDITHAGACVKGACLDFEEDNSDYLGITDANQTDLDLGNTFSIDLWFNLESYPGCSSCRDSLVSKNMAGSDSYILTIKGDTSSNTGPSAAVSTDGSTWGFYHNDSSGLDLNTWYHLVWVADGTDSILYLDGKELSRTPFSSTPFNGDSDFRIPGQYNGQHDGLIDHVQVYNYARTPAQVAWSYNRGKPLGHWKLDECTGTTANDSGSGGNNGTIEPGDTSGSNDSVGTCDSGAGDEMWDNGTTGKRNASLDFDGTNDYVQITGLPGTPENISLSAWANLEDRDSLGADVISLGDYALIRLDQSSGTQSIGAYYAGSSTWRATGTGSGYEGTGWHHFVYTVDTANNEQKIYVDGDLANTSTYSDAIVYTGEGSNTFIGRHGNGNTSYDYEGRIDEVKIWNYALTADQIKRDYNNGAVFFGPNEGSP